MKPINQDIKIVHVNPNCRNAEWCAPHAETGEVNYTAEGLDKALSQVKENTIEEYQKQANQIFEDVKSKHDFWLSPSEKTELYAEFGVAMMKYLDTLKQK